MIAKIDQISGTMAATDQYRAQRGISGHQVACNLEREDIGSTECDQLKGVGPAGLEQILNTIGSRPDIEILVHTARIENQVQFVRFNSSSLQRDLRGSHRHQRGLVSRSRTPLLLDPHFLTHNLFWKWGS